MKAGDTVWVQPANHNRPPYDQHTAATPAAVTKVGRRWVHVGHYRFEIDPQETEPYELDGGEQPSPGRVFLTEEAVSAYTRAEEAWTTIRRVVRGSYGMPDRLDIELLEAFAAHLVGRVEDA